jgi:hypothetical protein
MNGITDTLVATSHEHHGENITDALFAIADSIGSLAVQIRNLGNGNAESGVGAIEGLAVTLKEGLESLAMSLGSLSD